MAKLFKGHKVGYLFVLPWIIGFITFTAYPIFYSLYLSFFQVTITAVGIDSNFLGAINYLEIFAMDVEYLAKLLDFFMEIMISTPLIVILALLIALLLNQPLPTRGFFRTIFFLPVIISSGPVLEKLIELEVTSIPTLRSYQFYQLLTVSRGFLVIDLIIYIIDHTIILLWLSGVQILIFIAALQKVDQQIYEAARIDGASIWEIFWKITLPNLFPMILVNIIYTVVMYSVTILNPIIDYIRYHMFRIETGFGYASALSWLYFIIITVVLLLLTSLFIFFEKKTSRR